MDNITIKEGFPGQQIVAMPKKLKKWLQTDAVSSPFHFGDLGYYPNAHYHQRYRKKGSEEHIFIYCTSGSGWIELNDTHHEIHPGMYFIIPKNIPHRYGADIKKPWSIYWLHFNGSSSDSLLRTHEERVNKAFHVGYQMKSVDLFEQLFSLADTNFSEAQLRYACILTYKFVSDFIFFDHIKGVALEQGQNLRNDIVDFLMANIDQPLTAEDIAKAFNYSRSHLFNYFKQATGHSLMYYFNLKKIQKACEFLSYTDLSIKEISLKTGFQDQLYFSRVFKKYIGLSPRAYRNK
ncbi:AraC-type DNA-binding protein [Zhouia amylolytica]|uniref:AraC-type DNA-binding protein n=1 Tax=Zhouia amylolytica TaxID=376730 RepID=A0A1I6SZP1_9FLAO|nr:AraC family transcriptional regulator [Zhouia amylolytica]MCQ0112640.1 AraC family transcriptional regulator [Zhouia amylolytica]SFS82464.1 AraC-type DNA-binding protein [Zhouia amylolytica]